MPAKPRDPALGPDSTWLSAEPREVGNIGPYRVLQKLGEGGMGEVWLAEQGEPVRRQVALKVIKAGMDTRQVVARFDAERQALAVMDHPAIARVVDAGSTPDGRPYFAMEYVRGEPITTYCDRHRLSTLERLELFIQVCEGAQHAHQKGIIHRDLKPSNVLVTIQHDRPVPKIIDFGVAKAVAQPLTDRSLFTQFGVLIGTPEYMSPEQADMSSDIDTRTDVYALGMMLYQLLTGTLPFKRDQLYAAGLDAIRRVIREEDPPLPSTSVTTLGPDSGPTAARRRTDPERLIKQLRGDLDWIVMKALEKDRTRRYATASTLAADIRAHLRHEPVTAGAPGPSYRIRKFVRRHRFGVGAAASFLCLLLAFGLAMAVQAQRLARERDRANEEARGKEHVAVFLTQLFRVPVPARARGQAVTAREILDEGVRKLDTELLDQPGVQAELLSGLGQAYESLGLYSEAEQLLRRAVRLRHDTLGADHPKTLTETRLLAVLLSLRFNRRDESRALLSSALASARTTLGEEHDETLKLGTALATVLSDQQHFREAEALFQHVIVTRRRLAGDDRGVLVALNNLSGLYHELERYEDSARLDREVLETRRRLLGDDHPDTLDAMNNLAYCLGKLNRYAEARDLLETAIRLGEKVWGPTHPEFAIVLHTRGELAQAMGELRLAHGYLRRALSIYDQRGYARHRPLLLYELAQVAARRGERQAAFEFLMRALDEGYRAAGSAPGIAADPQLAALHGYPAFDEWVTRAQAEAAPEKAKPPSR